MTKVLHLSDLHYGNQYWDTEQHGVGHFRDSLVSSLVKCLKDEHLDAIVISGDLSQRATSNELSLAAQSIRELASTLNIPLAQTVVTPGNHDIDWETSRTTNKSDARFNAWRRFLEQLYTKNIATRYYPQHAPGFVSLHRVMDGIIITVSSCIYETHQEHYGFVGSHQLDYLENILSQEIIQRQPKWKMITFHHHVLPTPFEVLETDPRQNENSETAPENSRRFDLSIARDSGKLLESIERLGFNFVLHGHKHDPVIRWHSFLPSLNGDHSGVIILGAGSSGVESREIPPNRNQHASILDFNENNPTESLIVTDLFAKDYKWFRGNQNRLSSQRKSSQSTKNFTVTATHSEFSVSIPTKWIDIIKYPADQYTVRHIWIQVNNTSDNDIEIHSGMVTRADHTQIATIFCQDMVSENIHTVPYFLRSRSSCRIISYLNMHNGILDASSRNLRLDQFLLNTESILIKATIANKNIEHRLHVCELVSNLLNAY